MMLMECAPAIPAEQVMAVVRLRLVLNAALAEQMAVQLELVQGQKTVHLEEHGEHAFKPTAVASQQPALAIAGVAAVKRAIMGCALPWFALAAQL